jgi:hypothetical protein
MREGGGRHALPLLFNLGRTALVRGQADQVRPGYRFLLRLYFLPGNLFRAASAPACSVCWGRSGSANFGN